MAQWIWKLAWTMFALGCVVPMPVPLSPSLCEYLLHHCTWILLRYSNLRWNMGHSSMGYSFTLWQPLLWFASRPAEWLANLHANPGFDCAIALSCFLYNAKSVVSISLSWSWKWQLRVVQCGIVVDKVVGINITRHHKSKWNNYKRNVGNDRNMIGEIKGANQNRRVYGHFSILPHEHITLSEY